MTNEERPWYLAGPMSGYPQFNFPAFQAAAWALRMQGYPIISPHEEDPPEIQVRAWNSPTGTEPLGAEGEAVWGDRLAHDVKLISNGVYGLIMLPHWGESKGACLEATVGLLSGKAFRYWDGKEAHKLPAEDVAKMVAFRLQEVARECW